MNDNTKELLNFFIRLSMWCLISIPVLTFNQYVVFNYPYIIKIVFMISELIFLGYVIYYLFKVNFIDLKWRS